MLKVQLIAHTPDPEKVVAAAAKLCYSSASGGRSCWPASPRKTAAALWQMLAEMGHESPTEHASFTFAIEGVSRSLLAQITRHRIASLTASRASGMCGWTDFDYVTPPEIAGGPARPGGGLPRRPWPSRREQLPEARRRCSRRATPAG